MIGLFSCVYGVWHCVNSVRVWETYLWDKELSDAFWKPPFLTRQYHLEHVTMELLHDDKHTLWSLKHALQVHHPRVVKVLQNTNTNLGVKYYSTNFHCTFLFCIYSLDLWGSDATCFCANMQHLLFTIYSFGRCFYPKWATIELSAWGLKALLKDSCGSPKPFNHWAIIAYLFSYIHIILMSIWTFIYISVSKRSWEVV